MRFLMQLVAVGVGLMWAAGAGLRRGRLAEREHRRHLEEAARGAERTRVVRELHDEVTHHVMAMVVQAEAARYLVAAPERLDESLAAVAGTGRRAITDLRHLRDLLDPGTAGVADRLVNGISLLSCKDHGDR